VRPTLEVVLSESPAYLRKHYDETSGLALIALEREPTSTKPQGETNLPHVPEEEANLAG
jgi:hypothetical protein